ncbi:MAG: biopolymer transporter ExbD [Pseudoxanthomonas sp.]
MAFSASVRDSMVSEMNITPLVDVMLVLLVIFMVSAPLVSQPITAALPQSTPPIELTRPPSLRLSVGDDSSYRLDDRPLTSTELWQRLDEAVISDPRTTLRVSASSGADYQRVVTALAEARQRGIADIALQP